MNNKNSNELMVVKENLLDKIKNFFKKLFSKKQEDKIEEVETVVEEKENNFIKNVKIEEDNEEKRLLKLQALIVEEVITEDELPQEDIKSLNMLYDKQILDLKKSIDEYREKILKLRMNIND